MPELTVAQALIRFLAAQHVQRDGREQRFIEGCFGIFGHGNVAGIGQALQQEAPALRYYQGRNEQAMVHVAAGYARASNRLRTLACTSSVGPDEHGHRGRAGHDQPAAGAAATRRCVRKPPASPGAPGA